MNKEITIPYGNGFLRGVVPEKNLSWIVSPRDLPGVASPAGEVRKALNNPIGVPLLAQLVEESGDSVVLLVDDMTRSTPQKIILPVILDELNKAGVGDDKITALICLGTHRYMTEKEIKERFGEEVVGRIKFCNHDWQDPSQLVKIDNPNSNIPIAVNKLYYESDLSIAVGNIIPHMYAGWAGGAKMVQPGVCGEVTTAETHYLASENVHSILGTLDNPVRREIEVIARLTGLTMIVNTVLNPKHEIVRVVAGDPFQAHREGVKTAEEIYRIDIDDYCDIVVAGSYPAELDFWQSIKAMNNCAMAVRPGGTLVLTAADPEGIAPDHPDLVRLGTRNAEEAKAAFASGEIKDKVALSTYLAMELNRKRVGVILVSKGVSKEEASLIGLDWAPGLQEAIDTALERHGPDSSVGVVTHGADIYFRLR